MTLTDRLCGVPPSGETRICNDPSGCRRQTMAPDQSRCEGHRERWKPAWQRWTEEHHQVKEVA